MPDAPETNSTEWWLARLERKLRDKQSTIERFDRYYRGDHPLPEGDARCREMFKAFQRKARTNYMRLVADSTRERLRVVGFRTGSAEENADARKEADRLAWRIWQTNNLDADSGMVHAAAGKLRDSYVIVGPAPVDGGLPLITAEDPRQVITESDPTNARKVRAALKTWIDDVDGKRHAVLYLPDFIHYFIADDDDVKISSDDKFFGDNGNRDVAKGATGAFITRRWTEESPRVANDAGEVPVVRFVNSPTNSDGKGFCEFEDVIDIQDRINDQILNRLVIGKLQAYRQRWVKGIETEDENGNDLDLPFVPGVDLLWAVENENVEFGDFDEADMSGLLAAVKEDVQAIVTLTGLPPYYVQGDIVNASADAFTAAESRQVVKAKDRAVTFGEAWERVLRIAFTYLGRAADFGDDAEVQWADPERKSDAQLADAATKKKAAGVPWRQLMEDLGYTPTQIDRMEADRVTDAMLAATLVAAAAPTFNVAPPATAAPAVAPPGG